MPSPEAIQIADDLLFLCRGAAPLSSPHGYYLVFNDEFGSNDQIRLDYESVSPDAMWDLAEDVIRSRCVDGRISLAVMGRADINGAYRAVAFALVEDVAIAECYDADGLRRHPIPFRSAEWEAIVHASKLPRVVGLITLHHRGEPSPYLDHLLGLMFP